MAAAVLGGWLILTRTGVIDRIRGCINIDPAAARDLIQKRDAVIIDVREADEFASCRIPRSRHIPLRQIGRRINELEKYRERPILLNCRSGSRSAKACSLLRKNGYEAYNLRGGLVGWARANMSIED
jgi:rhodanese-related sulfurtransferase